MKGGLDAMPFFLLDDLLRQEHNFVRQPEGKSVIIDFES